MRASRVCTGEGIHAFEGHLVRVSDHTLCPVASEVEQEMPYLGALSFPGLRGVGWTLQWYVCPSYLEFLVDIVTYSQ